MELVRMNDPYSRLKADDKGTVDFVDDTGTIFCSWDCGSTLGTLHSEDILRRATNSVEKEAPAGD